MARFFLRVRTPDGLLPVGEGVELAHLGNFRKNATAIAVDLLGNDPLATDWRFEVVDESGRIVHTERVGDLVSGNGSTPRTPGPGEPPSGE